MRVNDGGHQLLHRFRLGDIDLMRRELRLASIPEPRLHWLKVVKSAAATLRQPGGRPRRSPDRYRRPLP